MKTFSILVVFFLSMLCYTASAAVMAPSPESVPSFPDFKDTHNIVKAAKYNGTYIPVVDLPVVEIIGLKPGTHYFGSVFSNGQYMVEVNLPLVEVFAEQTGSRKMPAFVQNGEVIAIHELPLIEIEANLPLQYMKTALRNEANSMAVVTLPEVVISAASQGNILLSVSDNNGVMMPLVNLPVIEISPEFDWMITASTDNFSSDKNMEWIYISLKNCGITIGNKIVCEVTSRLQRVTFLPAADRLY